jgi:hypothetical protein
MNPAVRCCLIAGGLALASCMSRGQTQSQRTCSITDENGKTVVWPNCVDPNQKDAPAPAKTPPARDPAKSFPFPGEATQTTAPAEPAANPSSAGAAQSTTGGADKPAGDTTQPASQRFPFPGDATGASSAPAPASGLQDAGSSGASPDSDSSSSSSSSSSSGGGSGDEGGGVGPLAGDDDPAAAAAAARAARKRLPKVATQTPTQREQEDLDVAAFYQNDGNYRGAYERALDAVSIAADDPDAHFALAEAARRLGKLDEAETHYKKCLTLDPVPKERKAAEGALKEMAGG